MNKWIKTAVLTVAVAATSLTALPSAYAQEGWRHHGGGWRHHGGGWGNHGGGYRYRDRTGDLIGAGVLGLAVGALAAGAATSYEPEYYEPVRPRRYYVERPRVIYAQRGIEPWTRAWFRYCENRYRSFDARTGTFTGYDGQTHFCTAN